MPKMPTPEYNLAVLSPHLVNEWHPTRNGDLKPEHVLPRSSKSVWWQCSTGNPEHVWEATINGRVYVSGRKKPKGCPYCTGVKVCPSNSLAGTCPDVAAEWHPTLNGSLTPHDVVTGSARYAYWLCSSGNPEHVWKAMIFTRTKGPKCGCPYCSGYAVCPSNSLATTDPALASEWHPSKNGTLTPTDVTYGMIRKVWWECRAEGHEWQATIAARSGGTGCPICKQSRGEVRITEVLDRMKVTYRREHAFNSCRAKQPLPFDFAIARFNGKPGLIEYQGKQHYEVVKYFGGEEKFKERQKNDQIKRDWCKKMAVPYLEIPYWDYKRIPDLVQGFVRGLLP